MLKCVLLFLGELMLPVLGGWTEPVDLLAEKLPLHRMLGQAQRSQHAALWGTDIGRGFLCINWHDRDSTKTKWNNELWYVVWRIYWISNLICHPWYRFPSLLSASFFFYRAIARTAFKWTCRRSAFGAICAKVKCSCKVNIIAIISAPTRSMETRAREESSSTITSWPATAIIGDMTAKLTMMKLTIKDNWTDSWDLRTLPTRATWIRPFRRSATRHLWPATFSSAATLCKTQTHEVKWGLRKVIIAWFATCGLISDVGISFPTK